MMSTQVQLTIAVLAVVGRVQQAKETLAKRADVRDETGGLTTEAVILIAALVVLAIGVTAIISAKVLGKAEEIDLGP